MKTCSFVAACNEYFGRKPGQNIREFQTELNELTPKDKADLIVMFRTVGFDVQQSA